MEKSRDILKKYASRKSDYFSLKDGEEAVVRFIKAEMIPNTFDGGKTEMVRYYFEVYGLTKMWDRNSRSLADQMSAVNEGDTIMIKRTGEKNKTRYSVRKVD